MTPYFTFAGYSGSGKTTLAEKVIKELSDKGFKIAYLKHDGHKFQMDKEGKDTDRLKKAGAKAIAISSNDKYAMISDSNYRLTFMELSKILPNDIDIIIGEGFKDNDIPKIIVHRKENKKDRACPNDNNIIAAVTDVPEDFPDVDLIFELNDIENVVKFIEDYFFKKK